MRDSRRKGTDGRKPLGPSQRFLGLLAFRDVAHDVRRSHDFTELVSNRTVGNLVVFADAVSVSKLFDKGSPFASQDSLPTIQNIPLIVGKARESQSHIHSESELHAKNTLDFLCECRVERGGAHPRVDSSDQVGGPLNDALQYVLTIRGLRTTRIARRGTLPGNPQEPDSKGQKRQEKLV